MHTVASQLPELQTEVSKGGEKSFSLALLSTRWGQGMGKERRGQRGPGACDSGNSHRKQELIPSPSPFPSSSCSSLWTPFKHYLFQLTFPNPLCIPGVFISHVDQSRVHYIRWEEGTWQWGVSFKVITSGVETCFNGAAIALSIVGNLWELPLVFVSTRAAAITKYPRLSDLNNEYLLLIVLGGQHLRSGCQHGWSPRKCCFPGWWMSTFSL